MKIKRYCAEYAADLLKPIKARPDLVGCPYQRYIETIIKQAERGRMTARECIRSLVKLEEAYNGKPVTIDIYAD